MQNQNRYEDLNPTTKYFLMLSHVKHVILSFLFWQTKLAFKEVTYQ